MIFKIDFQNNLKLENFKSPLYAIQIRLPACREFHIVYYHSKELLRKDQRTNQS